MLTVSAMLVSLLSNSICYIISLLIIAIMGNVAKEAKETKIFLKNERMRTHFYPVYKFTLVQVWFEYVDRNNQFTFKNSKLIDLKIK